MGRLSKETDVRLKLKHWLILLVGILGIVLGLMFLTSCDRLITEV